MNYHIDFEAGIKRLGGNEALYQQLVQRFLQSTEDSLSHIRTAIQLGNQQQLKMLLHNMQGASGNLSMLALQQALGTITTDCTELDNQGLLERLEDIEQKIEACQHAYQLYCSTHLAHIDCTQSKQSLIENLAELEIKLRKSDYIPQELVVSLKEFEDQHSSIQAIVVHVEKFEYALALALLLDLKEANHD